MQRLDPFELRENISTYVKFGLPVFPVHYPVTRTMCSCGNENCRSIGKHPMTLNGVKDATLDKTVIQGWFEKYRIFNVGVSTENFTVIDSDIGHVKDGEHSLWELQKKYSKLPETVTVGTGSGGQHRYFRAPKVKIKNKVNFLEGVDIRASGGYVVAPPSFHASGEKYFFDAYFGLDEIELAELPEWFVGLLIQDKSKNSILNQQIKRFCEVGVQEGRRNQILTSITGSLLARNLDVYLALSLVQAWNRENCSPPLDASEVIGIVNSIAGRERKRRIQGEHYG